jgi:CubicO group peptidase (beta-lactamase class C family)
MSSPEIVASLDRIATRYAAKQQVSELTIAIDQPATGLSWSHGRDDRPYFVASITKLFTAAIVMQLRHEGVLSLDAAAADVLGAKVMRGLVVHDGKDLGARVTIRELLSHTSGVPDYFEDMRADGGTALADMLRADTAWTFEDLLDMARSARRRPPPGRSHYSDTNFQLLGRIVETLTSSTFDQALTDRILRPLALDATWLFTPQTADRYDEVMPVRHGRSTLRLPRSIASFPYEGAVVSTTPDQLRFLRAWIGGELFPRSYVAESTERWRSVFSPLVPLSYGVGIMRFALPRWQAPFGSPPPMIGHTGAFGSVLFHVPEHDLYVAGTVNQMVPRHLPYPLLARLTTQLRLSRSRAGGGLGRFRPAPRS